MPKKSEYRGITASTRRLLNAQEGREVEFKREPNAVSADLIVAFANAVGGTILVGVSEIEDDQGVQRGKIEGCDVSDEARLLVANKAASCRSSISIEMQVENTRSNKPILRIDISEGTDKPYCTNSGKYRIRSEGRNVGIDPPLIRAIILESEADEFIARFKHASEELISALQLMEQNLSEQIHSVEVAAEIAQDAAIDAEDAARQAYAAAADAFTAAEDAAAAAMEY